MRRSALIWALAGAACGSGDGAASGGGGGGGGGFALSDGEAAQAMLELFATSPGVSLVEGESCPMEMPTGNSLYHVLDSEFPSHLFNASVLEFQLQTTFGLGPQDVGEVVACVDGADGYLTFDEPVAEGMPMMDDPLFLCARGAAGEDDALVGGSVAVSVGVSNITGDVGTYATTITQVCGEDGAGCEQPCANAVAPLAASAFDEGDGAVCGVDDVLTEDGAAAKLGRTSGALASIDGVPVSQACVQIDFPSTATNTVRVVGSWVQDPACGAASCSGETCGGGHGYGVWVRDGAGELSLLGMAQGGQTTTVPVVDPQQPVPPLVGDHFLAGAAVDTVVVCRLAFEAEADHVALDYVELCPS
ncbi:MAG: hypothetical protein AAF721_08310 [Myxococcota bacterium]